ncbi:hypothetical protein [Pelagibius marinus]|uniref:hypothetical protein n=1 Tax=Pelagibius marinus TaxID=2762760 RepID=UPI0018724DBC|nr:hypothetical protein [Pelagibius marinus]
MRLSRPLSVMILMAAMVAGAAWYAPPQNQTAQIAVMLPIATYHTLAQKGEAEVDSTGRPRSVVRVIEDFAAQ